MNWWNFVYSFVKSIVLFSAIITPLIWYYSSQARKIEANITNRERVIRLLPKGTRIKILAYYCKDKRSIDKIGVINGYSFGGTIINVVFNSGNSDCYEELIPLEKALDIIEVIPYKVD